MTTETSTINIPKNPASRRGWIIWQLRNIGWSLSRVARVEGVSIQSVSQALMTPSGYIQQRIADTLGLTRHQVWPEFYTPQDQPLGRSRDKHRITRDAACNVEEEQAA